MAAPPGRRRPVAPPCRPACRWSLDAWRDCGATSAWSIWRCSTRPEGDIAVASLACDGGVSLGRRPPPPGDPPGARDPGSVRLCRGRRARSAAMARPRTLAGSASARRAKASLAPCGALRFPDRRGRRAASDSGRPRACGNHRARTFSIHCRRRDDRPPRGEAGICPQGGRRADGGRFARSRRATRGAGLRRQHGRLFDRFRPRGRKRAWRRAFPRAPSGCAR